MLRTIVFKIILGIYFVAWSPILLVGLVSKKLTSRFIIADARGVLFLLRLVCGVRYKIFYPPTEENGIPATPNDNVRFDGKAIIASKHMSTMEVAILVTNIQNPFFILKRELLWIPVYGWAFWRMGMQPVNRAKGATNMKKLTNAVANKIMNGQTLIIFPEGIRVKPGNPIALKRGLMFLAQTLKLPIIPVGTDTGLYWPKHGCIRPGIATMHFEPVIASTSSLEEIHEAINRHSA
ncbi:MAG: 1-acyl-sn-glycerol-3-phosphate acyltransferase [Alphaproteobacteria bacterium]|nr:1-acyl-sn-glycerol-3-phosphate acyltransferase [Alphaproteobacteria bacterium]